MFVGIIARFALSMLHMYPDPTLKLVPVATTKSDALLANDDGVTVNCAVIVNVAVAY